MFVIVIVFVFVFVSVGVSVVVVVFVFIVVSVSVFVASVLVVVGGGGCRQFGDAGCHSCCKRFIYRHGYCCSWSHCWSCCRGVVVVACGSWGKWGGRC